MRALVFSEYGSSSQPLSEVVSVRSDIPQPFGISPSEVLIEVVAASLNPIDVIRVQAGLKQLRPEPYFPAVVGYDAAGVVAAVGSSVSSVSVGDKVFVRTLTMKHGSVAEYLITNEAQVAKAPANLSFAECAAVPLAAQTAYQAMMRGGVKEGSRVFISGGAGGVGTFAIQLAKLLGASFVATSGSSTKHELLRSLGADQVVDYKTADFVEVLPHDFDFCLDTTHESVKAVQLVKEGGGGQVVTISDTPTVEALRDVGLDPNFIVQLFLNAKRNTQAEKGAAAKGGKWSYMFLNPNSRDLSQLSEWLSAGRLRVVVDSITPLDDAVKAIEKLASGRATGKVIIQIRPEPAATSAGSSTSSSSSSSSSS